MAVRQGRCDDSRQADRRQPSERRIRGSTFRLTLAAILAGPEGLIPARPGRLERDSERHLSEWMRTHLHVAIHPLRDRDTLLDLEEHVLDELDPPLNLEGRPATAVRLRLTELRRRLAASTLRAATPSSARVRQ
jgi:hypothetical protein